MPLMTVVKPNKPIVFFLRSEQFYRITTDVWYVEMANLISKHTQLDGTITKISIDYRKDEPQINVEFLTATKGIVDIIIAMNDSVQL